MAFKNRNVTVGTEPVRISTGENDSQSGYVIGIKVPSGGHTVFIGGPGVTTSTGWPVEPGEAFYTTVEYTERLFAISASDQPVYVMAQGA